MEGIVKKYILISLVMVACASNVGLLTNRGKTKEQRETLATFQKVDQSIKDSFIKGIPCNGMNKDMIDQLFGDPANDIADSVWQYNLRGGKIGIIEFTNDNLVLGISSLLLDNPKTDDAK